MEKNPFCMEYVIGDDLHEYPKDTMAMEKGIQWMWNQVSFIDHQKERGKQLSIIASYIRILGELEKSLQVHQKAIGYLMNSGDKALIFVAELRQAQTYQFLKDFENSNRLFDQLLVQLNKPQINAKYAGFFWQHLGKNQFDQVRFKEALLSFERALEIREIEGNQSLIFSTRFAIIQTKKALDKANN